MTLPVHRRVPLIDMRMAGQNDIHIRGHQELPDGIEGGLGLVDRREPRMVHVGERARALMRDQISLEPAVLRGGATAAADVAAVRVERDHVPAAEVEGVVPAGR